MSKKDPTKPPRSLTRDILSGWSYHTIKGYAVEQYEFDRGATPSKADLINWVMKHVEQRHHSRDDLQQWRRESLKSLAVKTYNLEPLLNWSSEDLIHYIMSHQNKKVGEAHKELAGLEEPKTLYLVYQDLAENQEETLPALVDAATFTTFEGGAVMIAAKTAEEALTICAQRGLLKVEGDSRLVASELGQFYAVLVSEIKQPQPCQINEQDLHYPADLSEVKP